MTKYTKYDELCFNVQTWDHFGKKMDTVNVFHSSKVRYSIALYRLGKMDEFLEAMKDSTLRQDRSYDEEFAWYCFSSMWSRFQWEFGFGEPFKNDDGTWDGEKTDVFTVFILPNAKLLRSLVDQLSLAECKRIAREERQKLRERRKYIEKIEKGEV